MVFLLNSEVTLIFRDVLQASDFDVIAKGVFFSYFDTVVCLRSFTANFHYMQNLNLQFVIKTHLKKAARNLLSTKRKDRR